MATEMVLRCTSRLADRDMVEADQFKLVKLTPAGCTVNDTAGGDVIGVMQNTPAAGRPAGIAIGGRSKVRMGADLAAGTQFSADAQGRAIAAVAGHQILGVITESAGVDEIGSAVLASMGRKK